MDYRRSGQTVEVLIYDEAMRVEQAEDLLVANHVKMPFPLVGSEAEPYLAGSNVAI
jgi:hypothetical protein